MEPEVKDDPTRPYKLYAMIVSAVLTSFIADAALELPWYVVAGLTSFISGLSVYITPNPKVEA